MEALPGVVVLILSLLGCGVAVYKSVEWAMSGELPRNGGIGIRTRATQVSVEAWRAGHEAALPAARKAFRIGCVGAGIGVLVLVVLLVADLPILLGMIAPGICQLVQLGYVGYAVSVANRAARAVTASGAGSAADSMFGEA
ncbi:MULTISPECIES: SdpI family protein [Prauserella salsuginis group]|uniref:SdpI family protein n=1 Tax=Prauserella salsuginis TaxID=387889 RepID=A0ABW6GAR1_9PSEU|nr:MULTISPECIES: SdpI family protein [Prauserella salsuginis group]MCR3720676.1 SdpI/YhfL protein family protein [Prauserella flava]MCR3735243.1 SdpI/YhfL protein family protein [Prauserella salsuginis]